MDSTIFENVGITGWDWAVVGVFLSLLVGSAIYAKVSRKDSEDFFLAGRSMGWFIVTISIFASLFSTVSFVATPGESYAHGLQLMVQNFMYIAWVPLAVTIVLPFYFYTRTFSIYEYLENRFNPTMRTMCSISGIIGRSIYFGTVLFAASKIFSSLLGWHPLFTIVGVGIVTVIYCTTGGMRAVILTHLVQGFVVIVGICAIGFVLLKAVGFNVFEVYRYANTHGHGLSFLADKAFYQFDLHSRINFWMLILIPLASIGALASDQSMVQGLLTTKGLKEARKAVYGNYCIAIPVSLTLWFMGLALYYFYSNGTSKLPEGMNSDQVMGHFVRTQLPPPLPGVVMAALLAAIMGTIAMIINGQANLIHRDILVRFKIVKEGGKYEMLTCRLLSLICGLLGISSAVILYVISGNSSSTSFETMIVFTMVFAGMPISWAFVVGMLVPKVSGKAMTISLIIGWIMNIIMPLIFYYPVAPEKRVSFLWMTTPSDVALLTLPLLFSVLWPNRKSLTNLTVWTIARKSKDELSDVQQQPSGRISESSLPSRS